MTQPSTETKSEPKFDPRSDPDAQEALSIKYGNGALIVVPLKSGSLAIFDRGFQLHEIIDDPTNGQFAQFSFAFRAALANKTAEARLYGEPDDESYKRGLQAARKAAHRLESRPDKTIDTSTFEF